MKAMRFNAIPVVVLVILSVVNVSSQEADRSWKGKEDILPRAGVKLEMPAGEKIAPRTSGFAKDLTFTVLKENHGKLLIESDRQRGWIAKDDAVLLDQDVAHFTEQLARHPEDSHALTA